MLDTALIGLGRIASLYSSDKAMSKSLNFSTHAQVLDKNKNYNWIASVDPSIEAITYAKKKWGHKEYALNVEDLENKERYKVIVLATPPKNRINILNYFPCLEGIIVEKPLGSSFEDSALFVEECARRGIKVQVNLTRRADSLMRSYMSDQLLKKIGKTQFVFGSYGRGLHNYGTHLVDLVRMLVGEIFSVTSINDHKKMQRSPMKNDLNLSFILKTLDDIQIIFHPLDFSFYREGSIDIWGEKGRIEILQEGLKCVEYPIAKCRSLDNALEISSENKILLDTGYTNALYNLYDNLSNSISKKEELFSPGSSALKTESIINSIFISHSHGGKEIFIT